MKSPIHRFVLLRRYARKLGWLAALRLTLLEFKKRAHVSNPSPMMLRLKNAEFPVLMRPDTTDRKVLTQIFVLDEYGPIDLPGPRLILDLGANVGYSSAYFLSKYPTASVLAIEPDPDNYKICCQNMRPFGRRANVIHGAVWSVSTNLALEISTSANGGSWATQVKPLLDADAVAKSDSVKGYDMATLVDLCNSAEIDLLKIDIEGSERELFSRNTESWLPRVRNLCIELHGADCEAVFFRTLKNYSYVLSRSGELTVCRDLRIHQ